jgi:cephalosporin-C deacetylase-like acetyl esterase
MGLTAALAAEGVPRQLEVHRQILELAARQEQDRRARFAAVKTKAELDALKGSLRATFLRLLGGLPEKSGVPPVRKMGMIDGGDYVVEKLVYESFPGYFVPALLYKPKTIKSPVPGVLSPCGHSTTGKSAGPYQILHINLAKQGYMVLTYDPVGQGERSQFWDAEKGRSRFNLGCGEHAVLGNPLYLLGTSLARYRIWDGMRGLDYLVSLPDVDASKIGCVGNSGGGTLTAYIAALDPRVSVAAICCYITTLRRRMGNRIEKDPDADPEQDIFGFVSEGIDHAGLLALRTPRPTLLGTALLDFFPIEGARESFAEAKRLYEVAGAGDRIERTEAPGRHGLSAPLRQAVYQWFGHWLAGREDAAAFTELPVTPRPAQELLVCSDGQANLALRSRPFLRLAWEEFERTGKREKAALRELLRLDPDQASPLIDVVAMGSRPDQTLVVCINGNETADWRTESGFTSALTSGAFTIAVVDPRGTGRLRPKLAIGNRVYADPLEGVEENIAYNAFLVGRSLLGMRVTDTLAAIRALREQRKPRRVIVCGRRDAALVAVLAAAVDRQIDLVATEEMSLSFQILFNREGRPVNAASILPGMLQRFGDVAQVLDEIAPRKVLIAAGLVAVLDAKPSVQVVPGQFSSDPRLFTAWIGK